MGFRSLVTADSEQARLASSATTNQRRNNNFIIALRVLGTLAVCVLLWFAPIDMTSGSKLAVIGTALFILTPGGILFDKKLPEETIDFATVALYLVAMCGFSFVGALWPAMAVGVSVAIAILITSQSLGVVAPAVIACAFALSASGSMTGQSQWYLPVGLMVVTLAVAYAHMQELGMRIAVARDRTSKLISAAPVFFWEFDAETLEVVNVEGAAEKVTGYTVDELLGMGLRDMVLTTENAHNPTGPLRELRRFMHSEEPEVSVVTNFKTKDGELRVFRHQMTRNENLGLVQGVSSDITEIRKANEQIRFNSEHDKLTGLGNRSNLEARLNAMLQRGESASIILININRFRELNDTLGHTLGDALLKRLARRYRLEFSDTAAIGRFAGDEFAILLDTDDRTEAMEVARRLARVTEQKLEVEQVQLAVSGTIGVVFAPEHGDSADRLLQKAEIAVNQAKRSGKKVDFYHEVSESINMERLVLSGAIADAIDRGEFELWFQPKINLQTSAIVGAEGLARWRHRDRGILSPHQFLELITLSGEYHRFTDQVISQGITAAARCKDAGHPIEIAVNLSALSFLNKELPGKIAAELENNSVDAGSFTVEITEEDIFDENDTNFEVFTELRELGLGISIDDFGTGHSSLTRLRNLPVSELKLDRSFIKDLANDPDDLIIVQNVIDLASSLGHKTVAEGVEDEEIVETLKELGCVGVQGFYYAKPMPFVEFLEFVKQWEFGSQAPTGTTQASA